MPSDSTRSRPAGLSLARNGPPVDDGTDDGTDDRAELDREGKSEAADDDKLKLEESENSPGTAAAAAASGSGAAGSRSRAVTQLRVPRNSKSAHKTPRRGMLIWGLGGRGSNLASSAAEEA